MNQFQPAWGKHVDGHLLATATATSGTDFSLNLRRGDRKNVAMIANWIVKQGLC